MARITKASLVRYLDLNQKAAELSRQARTLREEASRIEQSATQDLETSGKETITRGGFRLEWKESPKSVSWKNELVDAKGIDYVADVQKKAGTTRRLVIKPPKDSAKASTTKAKAKPKTKGK